ncbi:hypothetical protein KSP40_PGU016276 [Platanthera guangdongensis]|uniref:Uncharacterized protein n=1 Tax=Platanthera guangdongensis TaxID=2320717 RepID=A0ABR2M1Z2_9ASPA
MHVSLLGSCFKTGRMGSPQIVAISTQQPDSLTAPRVATGFRPNAALTLPGAPFQETWARSVAEDASPDYHSSCMETRFPCWEIPDSLTVTRGILVSFFSSAY